MPNIIGQDLSSEAYFLAKQALAQPRGSFVRITRDLKEALTLKANLEFFLGRKREVLFFPPHDTLPYTGILSGVDITAERMATLHRLLEGTPFILVVPWNTFFRKVMPPALLQKHQQTFSIKEEVDRETLVSWLVDHGYRNEVVVESPGDFAVRGGLIDIFPPQEKNPFRLEFEGDRLLEIREFDAATQTTLRKSKNPQQVILIPASEILYGEAFVGPALKQLKKFADALELPATLRREVAEKIETRQDFSGKETFLPAFYEEPATLSNYLPSDAVIFSPDFFELKGEEDRLKSEIEGLHQSTKSIERLIPPSALFSFLEKEPEHWERPIQKTSTIHSAQLKREWNPAQLKTWLSQRFQVRLVCHTPIQAERLKDLLRNQGIIAPSIEIGNLSHGFGSLEEGLIILTEEEIFGHKTIRRTTSSKSTIALPSFLELREGDTLVHEEHGVCRYKGLKHLKIRETTGDYLELEFLGGDKLFLPVTRLSVVQKYIGGQSGPPLDSLRGFRWKKLKEKAQKEVFKIAAELLKIHAQREVNAGFVYPPIDYLDEEFAAQFSFDETPDQAKSIDDVLRDMQTSKPMDRLICGDVGYGKTEVAMRAAFKAVSSGKQVAFIVPTTILALQHFETFLERFSKFNISVGMLSRFRSHKEQKETLEELAKGKVDIVIGTHRLLGEDILFKDLGLLIVDEEHRFGVRHKERIKKIRPTVDVLTLSATPIPRTLHMSLIGIKDLSIIHTPPVDRLAVRTFLAKWDEALVKHAISQELARGGQVFFIHNRVMSIGGIHKRLQNLFPDASIAVAHGQMDEQELEKVMLSFLHQKTQILLTTAIVESGIDVPKANTILIHRADTFGLAQLYQLRGRVGRSDTQAYCYLLVSDEETVTKEARQRLSVLTRYTELGAGFQIASHDLEIRGAGNLLGTSQSGFIEEIGYEFYTKLLASTIAKLKGEKVEEEIDPEIQLKISAFIPEDYIADSTLRMQIYKRMSHLSKEEEMTIFAAELTDRFGPLPPEVENLLEILRIKQQAIKLKLKSVKAKTIEEAKKILSQANNSTMRSKS